MKVAILGFDVEGRASFDYFAAQGHELAVRDQNQTVEVPAGTPAVLGGAYLDDLDQYDLLVRTAGLPPNKILDKNPEMADKITTHLNEFMKVCPTKNVIGVTGTKGKGTTSTLITLMLQAAGLDAKLGGNIGVPPLTFLHELNAGSWVVLELSSFQLIDLRASPHIGVCLMITPEHLNWHRDMAEYTQAKAQLFSHQAAGDAAVYFAENKLSEQIAAAGAGAKIPYYAPPGAIIEDDNVVIDGQIICGTAELRLLGKHNWQNICAAVTAVWQAGVKDVNAIRSVLTTFTGLEHRLEYVRELGGVSYYNDSFGTTPETAIVALQAFSAPKVAILGGSIKGSDFSELARTVAEGNVRQVILVGSTSNPFYKPAAPQIESALRAQGFEAITPLVKPGGPSMDEIVGAARAAAQPGDVVLLSTGCASFDIFHNYKERGEQFKQAVQALV